MWIVCFVLSLLCGCTAQERAKNMGGEYTLALPAGQKLVTVTWKESELWYLTRPMHASESPERYAFKEDSTLGLLEGTVFIQESR